MTAVGSSGMAGSVGQGTEELGKGSGMAGREGQGTLNNSCDEMRYNNRNRSGKNQNRRKGQHT